MRIAAFLIPAFLIATALPAAAPAQPAPNLDPAQCDALARMPNPPMTPEACRSMMASAAAMQAAQDDPAGMHPGDEAMTCDQIVAEMKTLDVQGPSAEHLAEGETAGAELQSEIDRAKKARLQKPSAELNAAQQRTMSATADTMGDMSAQMQTNPRFARLVKLAGEKNCRGQF